MCIRDRDNTVPDKYKQTETKYKKILAGVLVDTQRKIFDYLKLLDSGKYTHDQLIEILYFLQKELNIKNPDTKLLEDAELVLYLKRKLDRPCRVCGMAVSYTHLDVYKRQPLQACRHLRSSIKLILLF